MGEYADMMLEGDMCQGCGEYLGDGEGYARYCTSCSRSEQARERGDHKPGKPPAKKITCPICSKRIWESGVKQHLNAKHPEGV